MPFNSVAVSGLVLTVALLATLTTYTDLHLVLANVVAIGSATAWNYRVNSRWTWRTVPAGQPSDRR